MVRIRTISRSVALSALLAPALAVAQPQPQAQPAQAPRLTRPPRLTQFVEAPWPASAQGRREGAVVVLRLTISATGTVEDAIVTESAGADFDAAAVAAARRFVFEPAEVDGRPSAIRIAYRYAFTVREEAPTSARFEGIVRTRTGRRPVPGVTVDVEGVGRAVTDAEGRFRFDTVAPGGRVVTLSGERLTAQRVTERFEAGQAVAATYDVSLAPPPSEGGERDDLEIVVTAPPIRRQVVSTEVGADQARRIPGTQGDVLRVVENLPGVGRAAVGSGQLVVWGAAPEDTRVLLDGVPVPRLYHDGGLRSVVPGDFVQSVELIPGGYDAPYGRGIGGLVSATSRALEGDGLHGVVSADLYDLAASARANLGRGVRVSLGARRSHLDALLTGATADSVATLLPVPRYLDGQARVAWDVRRGERVELSAIVSRDEVTRAAASPDPARATSETRALGFERVWARWRRELGDGAVVTVTPWVGHDASDRTTRVGLVDTALGRDAVSGGVRANWRGRPRPWLTLEVGVDVEATRADLSRQGSVGSPAREGDVRTFGQPPPDQVNADRWRVTTLGVAPYAQADVSLFNGSLHVLPGLRVDPYVQSVSRRTPVVGDLPPLGLTRNDVNVEPRLALRWAPSRRVTVKAAVGRYAQAPQADDLSAAFGAPALGVARATHVLAGAAVQVTGTLSVEATGFAAWSEGLAVRAPTDSPRLAEALVDAGEGRQFGAQLLVRQELWRGVTGWVSYSLIRSERRAGPGAPWRLFDYDQTHVLTALVTWDIGRGFEVGARARYATGMPRTGVTGAWFDAARDRWQPTFGPQNGERIPDFFQLDVRVAKTFRIASTTLDLSLEVQNVTNHANPEEVVWNSDYSRRGYVTGLPILPVLGLRWAF
ncbi:MAG: TonB-dependent receptor [Polyangiales bacterium]